MVSMVSTLLQDVCTRERSLDASVGVKSEENGTKEERQWGNSFWSKELIPDNCREKIGYCPKKRPFESKTGLVSRYCMRK